MASFQDTPKGVRVQIYVKGQRDSATFASKREAKAWAAQRDFEMRAISEGRVGEVYTWHDALRKYAKEVSVGHRGAKWETLRLAKISREVPDIPLSKITDTDIQKWRDKRLAAVSPPSVLREMKLLNSVFEECRREWKWIKVNPCKDVRKPAGGRHRDRVISRREACQMLRALGYPARVLPRHAVAHAFLLALLTGMREGELAGLTWAMVHPNFVRLPEGSTKNGQGRDVPLSAMAKGVLAKMRGYHPDSVFNVSAGSIDTHFRGAKVRAGLEGFTFHDSRHTAATRLGRSGRLEIMELCKIFGWSDPKIAMIYFNPTADQLAQKL